MSTERRKRKSTYRRKRQRRQNRMSKKQIEEENVRTREIKEFEDYTKTNAYVEQIAHSKLGLVYPDETIFIDKDE